MNDLFDQRKQLILEQAAIVFAENGFYRTTIEEISERVKLGKGTVYRIIKNKEQLFLDLLDKAAATRDAAIFENLGMVQDLRGKLGRFIISLLRFARTQPVYYKILTLEVASGRLGFEQQVKSVQESYLNDIYQIFQEGIRQNQIREVNPLIASVFISKLIEGALNIFEREPNYSSDQIVLTMLDMLWNGFGKR